MEVKIVTVAVPVLNGGARFREQLAALESQRNAHGVELEILIVDSGSTDGSLGAARDAGARIIEIDKSTFQHGRTRNLAVGEAKGDVVALLTDDAVPASDGWLDAVIEGFEMADDVALVFGPQIAQPEHSHIVRRELTAHFGSWDNDGAPLLQRVEQTDAGRADYDERQGWYVFFSDANGALAKWAWEQHHYREVAYAEDQLIAREMIEAGLAKVFHPGAAVLHSHDYGALEWFKRYFDDYRGLLEVMNYRAPIGLRSGARSIIGLSRQDRAFLRHEGVSGMQLNLLTLKSLRQHTLRILGEAFGGHADKLPIWLSKRMSLDGRGGYSPADPGV